MLIYQNVFLRFRPIQRYRYPISPRFCRGLADENICTNKKTPAEPGAMCESMIMVKDLFN